MSVVPLELDSSTGKFRATVPVEAGKSSTVISQSWLTFGCGWTGAEFHVVMIDDAGKNTLDQTRKVAAWRRGYLEVPSGSTFCAIEGTLVAPASGQPTGVPSARLVNLAA
ncbi:hypothetical protein GCM10023201_40740 [Actinomycetospora corticicola]|uniref:Uncharacterized protein n=1 Tax=Actinomycetospora corticicola TaxID=663602 RepID=A0A7Y9DX74_9PSEU|nr:hypothetical protein [Actinomycetospora corticicola]NYD36842.1 hypothetical protein [Actinomycetospora corticicola]